MGVRFWMMSTGWGHFPGESKEVVMLQFRFSSEIRNPTLSCEAEDGRNGDGGWLPAVSDGRFSGTSWFSLGPTENQNGHSLAMTRRAR